MLCFFLNLGLPTLISFIMENAWNFVCVFVRNFVKLLLFKNISRQIPVNVEKNSTSNQIFWNCAKRYLIKSGFREAAFFFFDYFIAVRHINILKIPLNYVVGRRQTYSSFFFFFNIWLKILLFFSKNCGQEKNLAKSVKGLYWTALKKKQKKTFLRHPNIQELVLIKSAARR